MPYSPSEIAGFLAQEYPAIHGISPEVFNQNAQLVSQLGEFVVSTAISEGLLSLQMVGSRSNGYSELQSDLDIVMVALETSDKARLWESLRQSIQQSGIDIDNAEMAMGMSLADTTIPVDAPSFIGWVDEHPSNPRALFNDGVHATPGLLLCRLAVMDIFQSGAGGQEDTEQNWRSLRDAYASEYLGDRDRIRAKLTERLGTEHEQEIHRVITTDLLDQRRRKFGLSGDYRTYRQRLDRWLQSNKRKIQNERAYELLQDVRQELE